MQQWCDITQAGYYIKLFIQTALLLKSQFNILLFLYKWSNNNQGRGEKGEKFSLIFLNYLSLKTC